MDLHHSAATNNFELLRTVVDESRELIDSYRSSRELESVIIRHGLKGTPLHIAVLHRSLESVQILLERGADPMKRVIQCERGEEEIPHATALYLADQLGYSEIRAVLQDYVAS